jgi:large subunit ribosomal protein L9
LHDKLGKMEVNFQVKAGEKGKLFGSITSKDVADALKSQHKTEIDKKKIVLHDALRN